jgi:splicing factor 3B subunit 3
LKTLQGDDEAEEDGGVNEAFTGAPQAGPNKWASCIRLVDPVQGETLSLLELDDNEAAFSMCTMRFASKDGENGLTELYLIVGTVKDYQISPPHCPSAFLRVYRFENADKSQIALLHKTPVDHPPLAMACFQKRLVVGMGNFLRMYDLGKRKLLRKCENKQFPTSVQSINVMGDRMFVADMCESCFMVRYDKQHKSMEIIADTNTPRYVTAAAVVDFNTVAVGDKFGNVAVMRLPPGVSEEIEKDPTAGKSQVTGAYGDVITSTAPHKLQDIVTTHIGEIVTSIQKASLVTGGAEVLLYSTIMGGLGILVPFASREDVDFFTHLEMHMRQDNPPLCGRDHLQFRSYYLPVKDCVDGDLCEQYNSLDWERQTAIGEELVRVPAEVSKKLEEMRNRIL